MTIAFTKSGLDKIKTEYDQLVIERPAAIKNLQQAREMGDLSENAAYKVARSKLSSIDSRIRRLKVVIDKAHVVEIKFDGTVNIGCFVTVLENRIKKTYQVVGSYESDIANGKISVYSPVGKALFRKRSSDLVKISTPSGVKEYKIVSVKQ